MGIILLNTVQGNPFMNTRVFQFPLIRLWWIVCLFCVFLNFSLPVWGKGHYAELRTVDKIPLPGQATRFDYASFDSVQGKLYLAHLGDNSIVVFDVYHRRVLKVIPGVPSVHGVIAVPSLKRVFATVTGSDRLVWLDSLRDQVIGYSPAGVHPDGLAYDKRDRLVFISDETGKTVTVVDPKKGKRVFTIPLDGEVGNVRYDPVSGMVYAAVQTLDEIVSIDPGTFLVRQRIRVDAGCHPHGLRIDPGGKWAYVACQFSGKLLILDLATYRIKDRFVVGSDPDVLSLDPVRGWLVVASESGVVSVFVLKHGSWRKSLDQFVGFRAHTVTIEPKTGLMYFPLENLNGMPVLQVMDFQSR